MIFYVVLLKLRAKYWKGCHGDVKSIKNALCTKKNVNKFNVKTKR